MRESAAVILPTHEMTNQPPPLPSINLFEGDIALVEAVRRSGAEGAEPHLKKSGKLAGDERVQDLARLAHRHQPELRAFDRFGHRKDAVEFHPAYHELMQLVFGDGVHSLAWTAREGGHAARTALSYIWNQADQGVNCPTSMTYASVRALRNNPVLEHDGFKFGQIQRLRSSWRTRSVRRSSGSARSPGRLPRLFAVRLCAASV